MADPAATEGVHPRRRDWNAAAAVIAALIGLLALCVSGYTAWLQRQQVRAEVWPYLQTGISPSRQDISLSNKGVGPATVKWVRMLVDGEPVRSWPQAFDALGLPDLRHTPYSTINGVVISPGESIQQLGFRDTRAFARFYEQYPRIELSMCYCSALEECWLYDQGEDAIDLRTRPVPACPAPGADAFIDNRLMDTEAMPRVPQDGAAGAETSAPARAD